MIEPDIKDYKRYGKVNWMSLTLDLQSYIFQEDQKKKELIELLKHEKAKVKVLANGYKDLEIENKKIIDLLKDILSHLESKQPQLVANDMIRIRKILNQ